MKALVIVDLQNDFCPGGALAVKDGDKITSVINFIIDRFDLVVATQDWHPKGHGSFASAQGKKAGEMGELGGLPQMMWPDHCVQGTKGAEFFPGLNAGKIDRVFKKGEDKSIDSYSGFYDNGRRKATGLGDYLKKKGVKRLYVAGLATDYCVKFTALDAVKEGFETYLIEEASRGVDINKGDVARAVEEMEKAGVKIVKRKEDV